MFSGCTFFFQRPVPLRWSCCVVCPSFRYFSTWPCWPLIPVDLSSLIPNHAPLTFVQPSLLAPWVVSSSPEQLPELAMSIYSEGFWDGQWALLANVLSWGCVMCSSKLALGHVSKGRMNGTILLAFPLGTSSVPPTGTYEWKAIVSSTLKEVTF